jgi:hypothetical protein
MHRTTPAADLSIFRSHENQSALITGASSGIGLHVPPEERTRDPYKAPNRRTHHQLSPFKNPEVA